MRTLVPIFVPEWWGTAMSLLRLLISEIALRAEVRYAPIHTFALTAAEVVFRP